MYHSQTASAKCILTPNFLLPPFIYRLDSTPHFKFITCCSSKFLTITCVSCSTVLTVLHCHAQCLTIPVASFYNQLSCTISYRLGHP